MVTVQAVESAAKCLKPDAVFCSFSPCIEQVQRTCAALEENGFFAVRSMECLLRRYEVKQERMAMLHDIGSVQLPTGEQEHMLHMMHCSMLSTWQVKMRRSFVSTLGRM